jgi:2-methylcitrate dehydratase PrpD
MKHDVQDGSAALSEWAGNLAHDDVPARIREIVKACVIDTVGVAVAGAGTHVAGTARSYVERAGRPGPADVLGSGAKLSAAPAAFCNAVAAHALDFDDNCYAGFVHGSAVIIPAALALAQELDATGADLITAITAGAECEYAVGAAAGLDLYQKGWWTTGLLGPIGAGVAAGYLLKMSPAQMRSCIGLVTVGAGGSKACFGTDAKALHAGGAAEAGVKWACLAAAGATGPGNVFSHPTGFAALHTEGVFDETAFRDLGRAWRLEHPGIDVKKYPICLSSHAAVDAVAAIVRREGLSADDIESVLCDVPPVVVANLKHSRPSTSREAQFSMEFAIAATICCGAPGLDQLGDEVVNSAPLRAMMERVRMVSGPMWDDERCAAAPEGAAVAVLTRDGRAHTDYLSHAVGAAANPLTPEGLRAKFVACAEPSLGNDGARRLLDALDALDADKTVRDLLTRVT